MSSATAQRLAALALALCASLVPGCASESAGPEQRASEGVAPVIARAERAMARGDHAAAIAGYRAALERTPWNTRLERALVAAYAARAEQSRHDGVAGLVAAEDDLRKALEIAPDDAALRRSLAAILIDLSAQVRDPERSAALRSEARSYAPELESRIPVVQLGVERRMDMALELITRGQLDAGIDRLERLHADYPERADLARLLAQARVRKGNELAARQDYGNAGSSFDEAVALYAALLPCDGSRCAAEELSTAHRNRIVARLSAARLDEAREALAEAERLGLDFPMLRAELRRGSGSR